MIVLLGTYGNNMVALIRSEVHVEHCLRVSPMPERVAERYLLRLKLTQ